LRPDAVVPSVPPPPLGVSALPQPAVVVGLEKTPELPPELLVLAPELLLVELAPASSAVAAGGGSSPPQASMTTAGMMQSAL
jgi:hypothetical protein